MFDLFGCKKKKREKKQTSFSIPNSIKVFAVINFFSLSFISFLLLLFFACVCCFEGKGAILHNVSAAVGIILEGSNKMVSLYISNYMNKKPTEVTANFISSSIREAKTKSNKLVTPKW